MLPGDSSLNQILEGMFETNLLDRGKRGIKERLSFENSCNPGKGMWNHWVCYTASLGIVQGYLKIFE